MEYILTLEEFEKLNEKEEALLKEEREVCLKIKELAKENRNVFEDTEYQRLKHRISSEIPDRLSDIRHKKSTAKIIQNGNVEFDGMTVTIGTKVKLDYGDAIEEFTLLAICDSDFENNIISCNAPIARTIIGKKKGDIVPFMDGSVKILDVLKL